MFEGSKIAKKYKVKCQCPSGKMTRFVEPCMLFLLSQKSSYGYELMDKLKHFSFKQASPDPAMVYRTLRYLEKEGCVTSQWDTGHNGPAKRQYQLTKKGYELLHVWAATIALRNKVLEKFLMLYRKRFKTVKS